MSREVTDDIAEADQRGVFGFRDELETKMAFRLEAAEFGDAFDEEAMGLIAGAVDGGLGGVRVVAFEEVGFNDAASAQTPGSGNDFDGEDFFDGSFGLELLVERIDEGCVFGFFSGFDEVGSGEETESDGVGGDAGSAFGSADSGAVLGVAAVCGELSFGGHGNVLSSESVAWRWEGIYVSD